MCTLSLYAIHSSTYTYVRTANNMRMKIINVVSYIGVVKWMTLYKKRLVSTYVMFYFVSFCR